MTDKIKYELLQKTSVVRAHFECRRRVRRIVWCNQTIPDYIEERRVGADCGGCGDTEGRKGF